MKLVINVFFLFFISFSCFANECTREQAISAEQTVLTISNWNQLHEHYSRYSICDDGAIAEGYSEVVSILVSEQWNDLKTAKLDIQFERFILRHINMTWSDDKINVAFAHASNQCSEDIKNICEAIMTLRKNA